MQHDVKQLTKALASGSEDAYKTLFYMYYPRIRAFAYAMLKNYDDADDLAQMVLIRIWTKRDVFADVDNFDGYLFSLSKNSVLNFIASRNAVFADITDEIANKSSAETYNPEAQAIATETASTISRTVEKMPKQRQEIYRLSRNESLSNDEIATRMGIAKKTVENHLNLALNDIRKALKNVNSAPHKT